MMDLMNTFLDTKKDIGKELIQIYWVSFFISYMSIISVKAFYNIFIDFDVALGIIKYIIELHVVIVMRILFECMKTFFNNSEQQKEQTKALWKLYNRS